MNTEQFESTRTMEFVRNANAIWQKENPDGHNLAPAFRALSIFLFRWELARAVGNAPSHLKGKTIIQHFTMLCMSLDPDLFKNHLNTYKQLETMFLADMVELLGKKD